MVVPSLNQTTLSEFPSECIAYPVQTKEGKTTLVIRRVFRCRHFIDDDGVTHEFVWVDFDFTEVKKLASGEVVTVEHY